MRLHAVLRKTHEGAELLVLGSDGALALEAQAPLMNALATAISQGCACEPSCTHKCCMRIRPASPPTPQTGRAPAPCAAA